MMHLFPQAWMMVLGYGPRNSEGIYINGECVLMQVATLRSLIVRNGAKYRNKDYALPKGGRHNCWTERTRLSTSASKYADMMYGDDRLDWEVRLFPTHQRVSRPSGLPPLRAPCRQSYL